MLSIILTIAMMVCWVAAGLNGWMISQGASALNWAAFAVSVGSGLYAAAILVTRSL